MALTFITRPPIWPPSSTHATVSPRRAAWCAAVRPARPPPTTNTSKGSPGRLIHSRLLINRLPAGRQSDLFHNTAIRITPGREIGLLCDWNITPGNDQRNLFGVFDRRHPSGINPLQSPIRPFLRLSGIVVDPKRLQLFTQKSGRSRGAKAALRPSRYRRGPMPLRSPAKSQPLQCRHAAKKTRTRQNP